MLQFNLLQVLSFVSAGLLLGSVSIAHSFEAAHAGTPNLNNLIAQSSNAEAFFKHGNGVAA
jgi:hypothetical protein